MKKYYKKCIQNEKKSILTHYDIHNMHLLSEIQRVGHETLTKVLLCSFLSSSVSLLRLSRYEEKFQKYIKNEKIF